MTTVMTLAINTFVRNANFSVTRVKENQTKIKWLLAEQNAQTQRRTQILNSPNANF